MSEFRKVFLCKGEGKLGEYEIVTSVAPESVHPADMYGDMPREVLDQLVEDIETGATEWFMVKVAAMLNGREIADTYLGGCAYKDVKDFVFDTYHEDMVAETIAQADAWVAKMYEGWTRVEV